MEWWLLVPLLPLLYLAWAAPRIAPPLWEEAADVPTVTRFSAANWNAFDTVFEQFPVDTDAALIGKDLDDLPADFGNMTAVRFKVRCGIVARSDDTYTLRIRVQDAVGNVLASAAGGGFQTVAVNPSTPWVYFPGSATFTSFASVNTTATPAQWAGAIVVCEQGYTRSMGADATSIRVDAVELQLTYNVAAGGGPVALDGQTDAAAQLSGTLRRARQLAGQADAAALLSGALARARQLQGQSAAAAVLSGALSVQRTLAGQADAAAQLAGDLTVTAAGAARVYIYVLDAAAPNADDLALRGLHDGTDPASARADTVSFLTQGAALPGDADLFVVANSVTSTHGNVGKAAAVPRVLPWITGWRLGQYSLINLNTSTNVNSAVATLVDDTHHIAAGLAAGEHTITSVGRNQTAPADGELGAGAQQVWRAGPSPGTGNTVIAYEAGATIGDGSSAAARTVGMGFKSPADSVANGKAVYLAAVEWALGEDGAPPSGVDLEGQLHAAAQLQGTLRLHRPLQGSMDSAAQIVAADLARLRQLAARTDVAAQLSGTLAVARALQADLDAAAQLSGQAAVTRALAGQVSAAALLSPATLLSGSGYEGQLHAAAQLQGTLSVARALQGAVHAAAVASGTVGRLRGLTADLASAAQLTPAQLVALVAMSGQLHAAARLAGDLQGQAGLSGTLSAAAQLAADVEVARGLSGDVDAAAQLLGVLGVRTQLAGQLAAAAALADAVLLVTRPDDAQVQPGLQVRLPGGNRKAVPPGARGARADDPGSATLGGAGRRATIRPGG